MTQRANWNSYITAQPIFCVAAVIGVVTIVASSCSDGGPTQDSGSVITNSDGAFTVAGEPSVAEGIGDYTHGILTIENATGDEIRLKQVELQDPTGPIRLAGAFVVPPGRPQLYVSSDSSFPPVELRDLMEPLLDYVVEPFPEGEGSERNVEVVLHIQVDSGAEIAGYPGFCIEFEVGDSSKLRARCVDHGFYVCPDPTDLACGPEE